MFLPLSVDVLPEIMSLFFNALSANFRSVNMKRFSVSEVENKTDSQGCLDYVFV